MAPTTGWMMMGLAKKLAFMTCAATRHVTHTRHERATSAPHPSSHGNCALDAGHTEVLAHSVKQHVDVGARPDQEREHKRNNFGTVVRKDKQRHGNALRFTVH